MFKKILIANRGEIACRVIKTARRMGIATVAVFSDADRDAVHVEMADEAVHIGAAPAAQSYLDAGRILAACLETGAAAVHPGYGFLSERAAFCEALERAGITFIGPGPDAIRAMGDKIESKRFARAAGVSTVPGFLGEIADAGHAGAVAAEIGYPVMIKASAGGGGKGMRIARNAAEAAEGFERARSEARSAFGDDRMFIEKFVEQPRHIEIQVLADAHGRCIHLGERECSIQRRNQKVVEEAPSPFLDAPMRAGMGAQAVALAKAVGYRSAGTVEFIVDAGRNFFFLEMNTRLQVEHPVTELVTGLDLVEQMIRIAAGEPLAIAQDDVTLTGWAVESRIYAEDPFRGFLPSVGRLVRYRPPAETRSESSAVRNDTGVAEGSEISIHYDPMVAKLCTWGTDRAGAVAAMADALDRFAIDGIAHNIPFLSALMRHPRWQAGALTTGFIAEEFPDGFSPRPPQPEEALVLTAVAAAVEWTRQSRLRNLPGRVGKPADPLSCELVVALGGDRRGVRLLSRRSAMPFDGEIRVGEQPAVSVSSSWRPGEVLWVGRVGGQEVAVQVRPGVQKVRLGWRDLAVTARALSPHVDRLDRLMPAKAAANTSRLLLCPMPGLVVSVAVASGQAVKAGEPLAVVEAMKMENVLRADRDLTVARVLVAPGDSLAVDAPVMEFV